MASQKDKTQEHYLVFARKFRPQTFDEIVGQEPITRTLKNAIAKGRIAQSFLFTGPRGIGKTSTARIFAKALNCEKGLSPTPCNQCSTCAEITQGSSLDVLEIDGASNRGIDEIRNLRENVKFKPAHGRYKVYIIDEVHMLTGEAFNALLKTLEEPPEHVKFVFATTEVHKVPLTILSRCQRFNFRRIPTDEIAGKLAEIIKQEKIRANDQTLFLIAKFSEGSLRDGESLLDQLASFGEGEITESDVTFSLGLTGREVYFSMFDALRKKDGKSVLSWVARVADEGKDLVQFSKGLLEFFRNLLVLEVSSEGDRLIEGTEEELGRLKQLKGAFSREELLFSLTLIQQLSREARWSETPRFLAEACLLKIANRADLKAIDDVLNELKALSKGSSPPVPAPVKHAPSAPLLQEKKESRNVTSSLRGRPTDGPDEATQNPEIASAILPADKSASLGTLPRNAKRNSSVTLSDVGRVWPELLERVKAVKMSCGTYLSESEPVEVVDGFVVFGFPIEFKFHKEAIEKQNNKDLVRSALAALLGQEVGVSFVVTETVKDVSVKKPEPALDVKTSDIITSALNIFDGSKVVHQDP